MNVYRKCRLLIVAAAVVATVIAYFVSSSVESRLAHRRVEALMEPALQDMREDVLAGMDSILYYLAACIRRDLPSVAAAVKNPARVDTLRRAFSLDEINFIDSNGVIRVTTHPKQLGYWIGADPDPAKAAGFLCLLKDHLWYTQPPRETVNADGAYRKFVGVWLTDGALQVGFDLSRLSPEQEDDRRNLKARFADIAVDRHVGESGYYVVADRRTGEVISDGNPRAHFDPNREVERPARLSDLGFTPEMLTGDGRESFRACISDEDAVCRVELLPESGHLVCVVVPLREVSRTRNISVGTMMFILLVLIATAAFIGLRAVTLRERAELERLAEELRRQKELTLATSIQSAALPSEFPPFPSIADCVDIYAQMRAAKEVGGDFYDFYFVSEHRLAFVVADVSGKGVPGAMFMMRAKTTLNDLLSRDGSLGEAVAAVNARLAEGNDANMFVTAWIGVLDLETGSLEYVNCGHNPPLIRYADGRLEWLRHSSGLALAALDGVAYEPHTLVLRPGDRLFLYTDGIVEAQSHGEFFGEDRLAAAIDVDIPDAKSACHVVSLAVDAFAAGEQQADDITMLAVGFNGVRRTFAATVEGLAAAAAYVKGFCADPKAAIVIDEIASNIVRCSGAETFELTYRLAECGYALVFSDAGTPFNPLTQPSPDVTTPGEDRPIGGLGIFMVKKMAEFVTYERRGAHNVLTVCMKGG